MSFMGDKYAAGDGEGFPVKEEIADNVWERIKEMQRAQAYLKADLEEKELEIKVLERMNDKLIERIQRGN